MTANEIGRQKYLALMTQVEELEEQVAALEKKMGKAAELAQAQEKLAAARTELTRVSNGCGQPRA